MPAQVRAPQKLNAQIAAPMLADLFICLATNEQQIELKR